MLCFNYVFKFIFDCTALWVNSVVLMVLCEQSWIGSVFGKDAEPHFDCTFKCPLNEHNRIRGQVPTNFFNENNKKVN